MDTETQELIFNAPLCLGAHMEDDHQHVMEASVSQPAHACHVGISNNFGIDIYVCLCLCVRVFVCMRHEREKECVHNVITCDYVLTGKDTRSTECNKY